MLEKLSRLLAPLALAAAAGILALRWDEFPDRWPIHWNGRGAIDGWATRSIGAAFGPLIAGVLLFVVFELIAVAIVRLGAADDPLRPLRVATALLVRLVGAVVTAWIGLLAVTIPLGPHLSIRLTVGLLFGLLLVALAVGARALSGSLDRIRTETPDALPKGYNAIYYANPDDPRLWVPKLGGMGTTLNFARPAAFWLLALFLAPVVLGLGAVLAFAP